MFILALTIILLPAGIIGLILGKRLKDKRAPDEDSWGTRKREQRALGASVIGIVLILASLVGFGSRSFVTIQESEVGKLTRIYSFTNLPKGHIIGLKSKGEKGPQDEILGPGFHFIPFVKVLYDVVTEGIYEIPEGTYGFLTTKDGAPLRNGQFIADEWPEETATQMLDANYFLTTGNGQKGPQLSVLPPGRYRINSHLFTLVSMPALDVPTGHVAVIRSNVQTKENCPAANELVKGEAGGNVATPIVSKGCIGVWDEPLYPGRYYMNAKAYIATIIPTRVETWTYKGGYTSRKIDLTVNDNGTITQQPSEKKVPIPDGAADGAITVRAEGWTFPVEMRVVVQVHPKDAPKIVATVGDLQKVEDKIVTPVLRDELRTVGGNKDTKVMDFVENRNKITSQLEKVLITEAYKAGVTIQEVRMGEPNVPPELLVARLRKQLADQLKKTYEQEKKAQKERVNVEKERATADQQAVLVKAQIAEKAEIHYKNQAKLKGEGEKLKLMEIAKGQKAQVAVLGEDRTLQLQLVKEILAVAEKNPDIIKVPMVEVRGGSGLGLEGAAAVLGASNFTKALRGTLQPQAVK